VDPAGLHTPLSELKKGIENTYCKIPELSKLKRCKYQEETHIQQIRKHYAIV
jgi:hypothetical protein